MLKMFKVNGINDEKISYKTTSFGGPYIELHPSGITNISNQSKLNEIQLNNNQSFYNEYFWYVWFFIVTPIWGIFVCEVFIFFF